jgi:hypothetical protein
MCFQSRAFEKLMCLFARRVSRVTGGGGMVQQFTELRVAHLSRCANGHSYPLASSEYLAKHDMIIKH